MTYAVAKLIKIRARLFSFYKSIECFEFVFGFHVSDKSRCIATSTFSKSTVFKIVYQLNLPVSALDLDTFNLTTICYELTSSPHSENYAKSTTLLRERPDRNTGDSVPCSLR